MGNFRGPRLSAEDFADIIKAQGQRPAETGSLWDGLDIEIGGPVLVGSGPAVFTAVQTVELWPSIIYDPNAYYASLGVSPRATREEIRKAYQALGGQDSPRLTYIVSQLLDPEIRRAYDATPLGSMFFDEYVETRARVLAAERVSKLLQQGARHEDLEGVDMVEEMFDTRPADGQTAPDDTGELRADLPPGATDWSYYTWRTYCRDEARIWRWRALVVRYLARLTGERRPVRVAVGFCGDLTGEPTKGWTVGTVGSSTVIFLGESALPTRRRAKQAARAAYKRQREADKKRPRWLNTTI